MNNTINYSFVSVRMAHSLANWAMSQGITASDAPHFAKDVLATVRRSIRANAAKEVTVTKKSGEEVQKQVKSHEGTQRATGSALLKLTMGNKEEFFISTCPKGIQSLVRQDQILATLEKTGDGAELQWIPNSYSHGILLTVLADFKASRGSAYAEPVPKSEEQATLEECQLQGL